MTLTQHDLGRLVLASALSMTFACGSDSGKDGGTDDSDDDTTTRDASTERADASSAVRTDGSTPKTDAAITGGGSAIYTGEPSCDDLGVQLQGKVDGNTVDETRKGTAVSLPTSFRTLDQTSDGEVTSNLRLAWDGALSAGATANLNDGFLALPGQPSKGPYCVMAGKIGLAAKQPASGTRYQFRVTSVQESDGSACTGAATSADLRGCIYVVSAQQSAE
jgi:hypothetical protein